MCECQDGKISVPQHDAGCPHHPKPVIRTAFQVRIRNESGLVTPEVVQRALERGGLAGAKVEYA